jgi:HD-GYP domain-containing protein (c-di-GMP phosphodiesterase class II)
LIIEDHARITSKLLSQLPFPKKLAGVPRYAGEHHEKLDGSGYHRKIEGKDLSIQSRIIAFADIFEALTAKDRPYRKPMKLSQAIKIMTFMKKDRHIDGEIFDLFIKENLVLTYAEKEMSSEQIDQFNLEID